MRVALTGFPLSTPVRMVNRIHDDASHMRPAAEPARPARLSNADILMIHIADLSDRRHAGRKDAAHFSRLESHLDVFPVSPHDLREPSGAPD